MELPKLSATETLILELLLHRGELYGLQMVAESGGRLKRGTVYVTLKRMADKGYVASRAEELRQGGGLPRRLYRATGYGQRVYEFLELMRQQFAATSPS